MTHLIIEDYNQIKLVMISFPFAPMFMGFLEGASTYKPKQINVPFLEENIQETGQNEKGD